MTAFSNGFEWDCWAPDWCQRCVHEETCPILTSVILDNEVPPEWNEANPGYLKNRYICSKFEEVK